jgi:hypothetical protein
MSNKPVFAVLERTGAVPDGLYVVGSMEPQKRVKGSALTNRATRLHH